MLLTRNAAIASPFGELAAQTFVRPAERYAACSAVEAIGSYGHPRNIFERIICIRKLLSGAFGDLNILPLADIDQCRDYSTTRNRSLCRQVGAAQSMCLRDEADLPHMLSLQSTQLSQDGGSTCDMPVSSSCLSYWFLRILAGRCRASRASFVPDFSCFQAQGSGCRIWIYAQAAA